MTYQQLLYFYHAANSLSFSKAAAQCFVAQTAVSKQIQNLEDELHCMLFNRSGRQLELTAAGENLKSYATRIIKLWNDSIESTMRVSGTNFEKSYINVGYWGPIDRRKFAGVFNDFLNVEPNCTVFYSHLSINSMINSLRAETVDLIVAPEVHMETFADIRHMTLFSSPFGLVMSTKHPLAKKEKIYPMDIINETFIERIVAVSEGMCNSMQRCWRALGFYPQKFFEVNEYKSAVLMVSNNMGVTISPEYIEEIRGEDLTFRLVEGLEERENMALGYVDHNDKPVVKRFLKYMEGRRPDT